MWRNTARSAQVHACHPARLDQAVDQPRADRRTEIDRQPGGPPLAPCAFGHGQHPADQPGEDHHHQQHRRANDGIGGGVRPAGEGVPKEGARGGRAGGNAHGDEIPGEHQRNQDADQSIGQELAQGRWRPRRLRGGGAPRGLRSLRLRARPGCAPTCRFSVWLKRRRLVDAFAPTGCVLIAPASTSTLTSALASSSTQPIPTATSTPARTQKRVSVEAMAMPKCTSTKCATMAAKSTRISSWRRPLVCPAGAAAPSPRSRPGRSTADRRSRRRSCRR